MKTLGKKYFEYFGCLVSENRFCLTIIYLFKVNSRNTIYRICSKLIIDTPERRLYD